MPLRRPPQHRADAQAIYVDWEVDLVTGPAWKKDEFEAEIAEVRELNKTRSKADQLDTEDHPVRQYLSGRTRLDIDAPIAWRGKQRTAREWLNDGAVMFLLRRFSWSRWYEVTSIESFTRRTVLACQLGLGSVEGDDTLDIDPDAERRSSDEMQRLFDVDSMLPIRIGLAAIAASRPLTDGEKKP